MPIWLVGTKTLTERGLRAPTRDPPQKTHLHDPREWACTHSLVEHASLPLRTGVKHHPQNAAEPSRCIRRPTLRARTHDPQRSSLRATPGTTSARAHQPTKSRHRNPPRDPGRLRKMQPPVFEAPGVPMSSSRGLPLRWLACPCSRHRHPSPPLGTNPEPAQATGSESYADWGLDPRWCRMSDAGLSSLVAEGGKDGVRPPAMMFAGL